MEKFMYVKNGKVVVDGTTLYENGSVLLRDGKIFAVYNQSYDLDIDCVVDAKGNYIIPGLIETHTHGIMGHDFNLCSNEDLKEVSEAHVKEGVTTFMASLVGESHERIIELLDQYEQADCHNLLGVHVEGPFLSPLYKGVMKEDSLVDPNMDKFKEYLSHCSKIKSMTIAPELDRALDIIQYGNEQGIVMNVGHSNASPQIVLKAQEAGAKGITHLYNAMAQHLHREPGVVTGAIISDLYCELIVDGFHIHEDVVKATYKAIGKDRLVMICDANPCKGLPDGEYEFSGKNVLIVDGKARVKETGRIAGSTITLNKACLNMKNWCGCSMNDIVQMACVNPATMYQLNKGMIKVGYDGDLVIVNEEMDILAVINNQELKINHLGNC